MRNLILVATLVFIPVQGQAFNDVDIKYTGHSAARVNDILGYATNNNVPGVGLGGPVANQAMTYKAFEFTVGHPYSVNYFKVDAAVRPWEKILDKTRSEYIHDLQKAGLTDEEIGAKLKDLAGPRQSVNVQLDLIEGSIPYQLALDSDRFIPSNNILATGSYTFNTDNSRDTKQYNDLFVPLSPFTVKIKPENKYWLAAHDEQTGIYFDYSEGLIGQINAPEPASLLLMGGGLAGMFFRRRKRAN